MAEIRDIQVELQPGERTGIPEPVRKFLALAMKRWKTIAENESKNRQEMLEDLRFRASDQWPDTVKNGRQADNRPCLTINRLPEFIRQVTNVQRQNRPAVKVNPVDNFGDVETAEVFQGLIRHIENVSNADVAYTQAGEHQATMGRGYWRVLIEYVDDRSNQLQIKIKRVSNPFSIYMDVSCTQPDMSDARYAFVVEDIPREEFKIRYSSATFDSLTEMITMGNQGLDWMPEGKVRVAEYFYTDYTDRTLVTYALADGSEQTMFKEEWEAMNAAGQHDELDNPTITWEEVDRRTVHEKQIKWALISAGAILEGNDDLTAGREWPGKFIPIIQVVGDEIDLNGVKDYRGMVRDARDPQRMVNYWESALTEAIALAPKAPWLVAKGQIENFEGQWNTANTRNWPYLQYNHVETASGKPLPQPQRQTFEPAIQAIAEAARHADQNLKNVTGFQDPSLGKTSTREVSGKAIVALQKQAELGSSNYLDNLGRSIRYTGEVLVDLIPKIYKTSRMIRILGEDERIMKVNVFAGEQNAPQDIDRDNLPEGLRGVYDLDAGQYDVTVSVGRAFETRRQEAVETITELFKVAPEATQLGMDILVENMDVPWAQKLSQRFKLLLPPAVQEGEESNLPPQAVAEINQLKGQLQEVQQIAEEQGRQIATDEHKERIKLEGKQAEIDSRERIAAGKDASARHIADDATDTNMDIAELVADTKLIIARLDARLEREKLDTQADTTMVVEGNKADIAKRSAAAAQAKPKGASR